jgi:RNA polymerase sigma factor (sigma-70 family)
MADGAAATDQERIDRLLRGDAEALQEAGRWIRGAASAYGGRLGADREDLEQEALVDLLEALRQGRFRGEAPLRSYARKLVHHACIDRLRAARTRRMETLEGLEVPSSEPSAFGRLAEREAVGAALRVFAQVPAECRDLWRAILAGESYGEMSRRRGVSEGALRVRVLRCRRRALELRNEAAARPTVAGDGKP